MYSTCYSCPVLVKVEYSWQIFEKYSNIKFHENPSSGSRVVPCGRTDRHEPNSRLFAILGTRLKIVCVSISRATWRNDNVHDWYTEGTWFESSPAFRLSYMALFCDILPSLWDSSVLLLQNRPTEYKLLLSEGLACLVMVLMICSQSGSDTRPGLIRLS